MTELQALAKEHHSALGSLSVLIERQLLQVWDSLTRQPPKTMFAALLGTVPDIGDQCGDMAAALSMDFYESAREIAGAPGRFVPRPAPLPTADRYQSLLYGTLGPLFDPEPNLVTAFTNLDGGLQRVVADVSRDTIVDNSARDPKATGWSRIARTGSCPFCRMLAAKGAIYKDVGARFASHGHCHCVAAPSFSPGTEVSVLHYKASERERTDADRAQIRAYLKRHFAN